MMFVFVLDGAWLDLASAHKGHIDFRYTSSAMEAIRAGLCCCWCVLPQQTSKTQSRAMLAIIKVWPQS